MDSISAAKARVYASTTHWSPDMPPPNAEPIDGRATFTTDASRVISAKPRSAAARVSEGEVWCSNSLVAEVSWGSVGGVSVVGFVAMPSMLLISGGVQ
ncbi:hypothetical protein ACWKT5_27710 [Streptomyces avermitilis]